MADKDELEETTPVDSEAVVDSVMLGKLKKHKKIITGLKEDFGRLKQPGAGLAEVKKVVERAQDLEAKLGVPLQSFSKEVLEQSGVPVQGLEQAQSVVEASSSCETALEGGRHCLQQDSPDAPSPPDAVNRILLAWAELSRLDQNLKLQKPASPLSFVDLGLEKRSWGIKPVLEALLDQAASAGAPLADILSKDYAQEALTSLGVQAPSTPTLPQAGAGASESPPPVFSGTTGTDEASAGIGLAGFVAARREELEKRQKTEGPGTPKAAPAAGIDDFTFSSAQLSAERAAAAAEAAAQAVAQAARGGAPAAPTSTPGHALQGALQPQGEGKSNAGPPELWRAVHVGDEAAIKAFVQRGQCNGAMVDGGGHSVLWHSIVFGHHSVAKLMLETFPPGSEGGVNVSEVHPRRGDNLLHLLCQCRPFGAETAAMFKKLCGLIPEALWGQANAAGDSFLTLAAKSLNFWVLKFCALNHAAATKALLCSEKEAPLRAMADLIPKPTPPGYQAPPRFPEHFAIATLLNPNKGGQVPFADVAFDVGPPENGEGSNAERVRFLAHRIVVGSQSQVLLKELEKTADITEEGVRIFRVNPRISKDVWRIVLQFLYTSVVSCPFAADPKKLVELFCACALYALPKPLVDYTQCVLFQMLPGVQPSFALQVFNIATAASEGVDVRSMREASAFLVMRNAPLVLKETPPEDVAKLMEKLVQTVELAVFHPTAPQQQVQAAQNGYPAQAQQYAALKQQQVAAATAAFRSGAGQQPMSQRQVMVQR